MREPFIYLVKGTSLGLIYGLFVLIAISLLAGISELNSSESGFYDIVYKSLIFTMYFSPLTLLISVGVSITNSLNKGGIAAGAEWFVIVGATSIWGSYVWNGKVDKLTIWLGIVAGLVGGMIGWISWLKYRVKGVRKKITGGVLVGHLFVVLLILVICPLVHSVLIYLGIFDD